MTKKILSIAGIAAVVGIIMAFIGMCIVGFDFEKLDLDKDYTEKIFTVSDSEISSVNVYTDCMKVKVCYREDDSNEIRITYYENDKHKPTIANEDGTITLNDKEDFWNNFFNVGMFNIKRSRLETLVEVPKNNKTLKINIETSNAKITADGLTADKLSLKTSNASIDVSGKFTNDVYCKTSNASIDVSGEFTNDVYCDTSNGNINAKNITAHTVSLYSSNASCNAESVKSKNLNVGTSNASINITNINSDSVKLETSNASINLGDTVAKDSFYADTSNGSINTRGIDSDKIELHTSNSSITATIVGDDKDFAINSGTSNGNDNLYGRGNNSASKQLSVYTSNGNINIKFDDQYTVSKGLQNILS